MFASYSDIASYGVLRPGRSKTVMAVPGQLFGPAPDATLYIGSGLTRDLMICVRETARAAVEGDKNHAQS